jgi:hypothetical protein
MSIGRNAHGDVPVDPNMTASELELEMTDKPTQNKYESDSDAELVEEVKEARKTADDPADSRQPKD